jgi:hypothetical protein
MPDEEKSGQSLRMAIRRTDEALIAAVQGWTVRAILLPAESCRAGKRAYFPWIGLSGKTGSMLVHVATSRERTGFDDFWLSIKPFDRDEAVNREIRLDRDYHFGLETLYFDTDSEEDPSRIEAIRVYETGYNLRLAFGLSRQINTLMYLEEFEQISPF